MTKFWRIVGSPSEYKETCNHASELGFELHRVMASGDWETADGDPIFLHGTVDVEMVGRVYFHIVSDGGEVAKCKPVCGHRKRGELQLEFWG